MGNQDAYSGRRYSDDSFTSDKTMELFRQPDVQCVDDYQQVYQARTADTPEKRLAMAILRDAIGCYMHDCLTPERHRIRVFRDAEVWFFAGAGDGIFSLNNVCEILHLEPAYIRRRLRNYEHKHSRQRKVEPAAARIRPATSVFRMAS
mgnify:CR=1 FL=1